MDTNRLSYTFDLITPDGKIGEIKRLSENRSEASVIIEGISPYFVGFDIDENHIFFNCKSTLAQLGINGLAQEIRLDRQKRAARVRVILTAYEPYSAELLAQLEPGAYIGKLFAADPRRRVHDPDYLIKQLGRADRHGDPLLSFGGLKSKEDLHLEKVDGNLHVKLPFTGEVGSYPPETTSLFPTLVKGLKEPEMATRALLKLHQQWNYGAKMSLEATPFLLTRTEPLHIRTVFAHVVSELLPKGYIHMSASILDPTTRLSGDVYEFYGKSSEQISSVPLEFYTLEPHRGYICFAHKEKLHTVLTDFTSLRKAFETAPEGDQNHCAAFIMKSSQLLAMTPSDWITRTPTMKDLPGLKDPDKQTALINSHIEQQAEFPLLMAMQKEQIVSEGVLFTRYLPTPLMKQLLLSADVVHLIKGIYFERPSCRYGEFFSHEDRSFLLDLARFGLPVYWVDRSSNKILKFVEKIGKDSGMFVPLAQVEQFGGATLFGIYGSNLLEGGLEEELTALLTGIVDLKRTSNHRLLHPTTPIALITGGGPGAMEMGNRVAQKLGLLSCANVVDFGFHPGSVVHEQQTNPYIDSKMTYRIDNLLERQAEFDLDFPIFLIGGIGTDFELALEEVRRKVGASAAKPILLFGDPTYWREKITSRFRCNIDSGTIQGSEWVSNCFYCITSAHDGLLVYRKFFNGTLSIGKNGPVYHRGFATVQNGTIS